MLRKGRIGYNIIKNKTQGVPLMNSFCKKFFTVYFAATTAAMVLLTCGFVHHLLRIM